MKRIYRIVAYLIFFVILPLCPAGALEIAEFFEISGGLDLMKRPAIAASYQPDYVVAQGLELSFLGCAYTGIAGLVSQTATSPVRSGVIYRGFVTIGGKLYAGYIHPKTFLNLFKPGGEAAFRAEFARYHETDLLFFYLTAMWTPEALFQLAESVAIRVGLPVSYSFRTDLSYHLRVGVSVAFLIG